MDKCRAAESRVPVSHLEKLLRYDERTGELLWKQRANLQFNSRYAGKAAGAIHKASGAIQILITLEDFSRLFWAHRIVWAMVTGDWPLHLVDHRDGRNTNNRFENLRVADGHGNGANRHVVNGEIKYRGVYFHAARGRFAAQIKWQGEWSWLGLHDSAEAAAKAYDRAAIELHGEFAVTNSSLGLFLRDDARLLI